jgi:hypothetical protein
MAITTPVSKSEEKQEDKKVTEDNITNKQLLTLVWFNAGSPCGSVQNWLDHSSSEGVNVWQ